MLRAFSPNCFPLAYLTAFDCITPLTICDVKRLVLETLEPLSGDRKCFRLINGVLVERTVKDVVPALKTNQEGLKQVLDDLVKQYKTKQDELDKWKVKKLPSPRLPILSIRWVCGRLLTMRLFTEEE